MSPRPILKPELDLTSPTAAPLPFPACSSAAMFNSTHVRFPPTPTLTSTHLTHSTSAYDRAPIAVQPNSLALPERGCPGRTYALCESESKREKARMPRRVGTPPPSKATRRHPDSYFPPLDALSPSSSSSSSGSCPELIPDHGSSESDDSDGLIASPPDGSLLPPLLIAPNGKTTFAPQHASSLALARGSQEDMQKALAFLPHPPSPVRRRHSVTPPKRERSTSSSMRRTRSSESDSAFAAPSMDACLGGF